MLFIVVTAIIKWVFVALLFVMQLVPLLTWMERRQSALTQDRLGPWRAYFFKINGKPVRLAGLLHPIADAVKMLFKEPFTPDTADKFLHGIAPAIGFVASMVVIGVVPFGPDIPTSVIPFLSAETIAENPVIHLSVVDLDTNVLLIFAFGSLGVYGVALAGWASNNRFALLGGLRGSAQAISYEVALGLTIVGILLAFGSTNTTEIVAGQNSQVGFGGLPLWGIVVQPLGALLFFIASVAETKRTPFDVPEGESEIIGYFVEYSSMGFGLFMAGEFVEVVVLSAVFTTLFLGGWDLPWIMGNDSIWLGFTTLTPESLGLGLFTLIHTVAGMAVWGAKVFLLCMLQLQIRWTLPRFRYDQVMNLGWKMLLPLALVNIVVSVGLFWFDPSLYTMSWAGCLFTLLVFLTAIAGPRKRQSAHGHDHGHGSSHGGGHDSHGSHGHGSHDAAGLAHQVSHAVQAVPGGAMGSH